MNLKTKAKVNLMSYGCADTSVAATGNGYVEVSQTARKVIMFVFDDNLSKRYITIGATTTAIGLLNVTLIDQLNYTPLIHAGANYLFSTAHTRDFGVSIHDVANHHGEKHYIHTDNQFIPTKFYKFLMYVPVWEPTQWDIDNLEHIIINSYYPWSTASTNDSLEVNMILLINNEVDGDLYNYLRQINSSEIHLGQD